MIQVKVCHPKSKITNTGWKMTEQERTMTRSDLKTPQVAAYAGIVFSVLFAASTILLRLSVPGGPLEEGAWLNQQWKMVGIALNLLPFAGIAFLWLLGVLRDRIGAFEDRFFATIFLGSGLLFLGMLFISSALGGSIIMMYGPRSEKVMSPEIYQFVRALTYYITHVYTMRMAAVFMICSSTISIRTAILPRWMSLLGYALALVLLFSFKYLPWVPLVFPIWVFIISIHILLVNIKGSLLAGKSA